MGRTATSSLLPSAIVAMVTTITLVLCLLGYLGYQAYARQQINHLDHHLQLTADKLSLEIAQPVWGFEFKQVHDIMQSTLRDQQVYGVLVRHGKDSFVLKRGEQWHIVKTPVNDFDEPGLQSAERDIVVNDRHIGTLTVFMSGDLMQADLRKVALFFAASILITDIVLTLLLYFLFWRRVLSPLKSLESYAIAVSAGNPEATTAMTHPLKDEFARLYSSLQQMVETQKRQIDATLEARIQAETANRTQSEFLAQMSHELRTPLNAILGYSRLMLSEPGLNERQQRNLGVIERSGTRLLNMISDILDLSKNHTGQPIDTPTLHPVAKDNGVNDNSHKQTEQLPTSVMPAAAPPEQRDQVLIVDDTAEIRMLLRDLLEPLALRISEANNAEEALVMIGNRHPHVVLLDWRLPGMSGIELTRLVRRRDDLPQPQIIMLTANAYAENRADAYAAGVDGFMTKPLDIEQLKTWLTQHFATPDRPTETESGPQPDAAEVADISQLTDALRARMTTALQELNPAKLKDAIEAIRTENPALATRLDADLQALRYRELWQLFGISGT